MAARTAEGEGGIESLGVKPSRNPAVPHADKKPPLGAKSNGVFKWQASPDAAGAVVPVRGGPQKSL
jgi:hypothetical protein